MCPMSIRYGLALLSFVMALAASAVSCRSGEPTPAAPVPAPAPPVPAPPARPAAVDVPGPVANAGESNMAAQWMANLRAGNATALVKLAGTPFDFRDTRTKPPRGCKSGVAADRKAVAAVVSCLTTDKLLHEDLLMNPASKIFAMSKETLPGWAKAWAETLRADVRPMSVFIHGKTSAFEIILLLTQENVFGVWQNVILEPK
jgi:hypothetical protein